MKSQCPDKNKTTNSLSRFVKSFEKLQKDTFLYSFGITISIKKKKRVLNERSNLPRVKFANKIRIERKIEKKKQKNCNLSANRRRGWLKYLFHLPLFPINLLFCNRRSPVAIYIAHIFATRIIPRTANGTQRTHHSEPRAAMKSFSLMCENPRIAALLPVDQGTMLNNRTMFQKRNRFARLCVILSTSNK